ncbi:MAG: hypothetical protein JJ858_05035 [Rhizobiaceae bacterium]|nr:hypothetical protein [Rhizobiaceae bacterium]
MDLAPGSPQQVDREPMREKSKIAGKIRSKVPPKRIRLSQPIANNSANDQIEPAADRNEVGRIGIFGRKAEPRSSQPASPPRAVNHTPEYANSYEIDPDKPLLDLFIIAKHIWAKKWMIVAFGFLGAVLGVLVALSTPHKYYADSRLILDPRDVQVTDTVNSNNQASSQVLLAVVDSQMQVARSTSVLERVVEKLRLDQDPEFNGDDDSGIFSKIKGILSSSSTSNDPFENAVTYLRKNMGLARDPETFLVYIGATTNNAEKSALVANTIVEEYLVEYKNQQSGIFAKTSTSIEARLEELRLKLDAAEKAIVDYRAENDIIDVGGGVINEKEMLALSNELAKVRADQVAKTVLANELRNADVNGVVSGSFPQAALTTTLTELRKQYTEAKSNSDSLAVGLGPRHPQYIAAKASADAIAVEISNELTRIVASTQKEVQRASNSEAQLADKLAVSKTRASSQSTENVGLRELERKAEAIRQIYESLLRRARETTERGNLETSVIQVIAKADPPQQPSTTSRKTTVILFGILGGMLGLAIAFIFGSIESLKQHSKGNNSQLRSSRASVQNYQDHDQFSERERDNISNQYMRDLKHGDREEVPTAREYVGSATSSIPEQPSPQTPLHHPVYPPQFNPVAMAPQYPVAQPTMPQPIMPQPVVPNAYPVQQAPWPQQNMTFGYPPQVHPQQSAPMAAQNLEQNNVTAQEKAARNEDREKVMRLKSDVQRLRAELEDWAQQRNR